MRAAGLEPPPLPERQGSVLRNVDDPLLIFENAPGGVQLMLYRDRRASEPRSVELRVNSQGFRGPEVPLEKPAGALRIACVGDSHTFGDGVPEGETWPDHLRRLLAERMPERPAEVLNCGVNGYDTLQEVLWMRRAVLPFEPDLVLLQYYVNDVAARNLPASTPPPRDRLLELVSPRRKGFLGWLRSRSRAAELVCDGLWRQRGLARYVDLRMGLYADASPGWMRVRDALRTARDELAARDIRLAVVLYPFLLRDGDHLTSHDAFTLVSAFCASEGIPCFDAEPAFAHAPVEDMRVSPHDYHGNGEANAIFARAVADWLGGEGAAVLPPQAGLPAK